MKISFQKTIASIFIVGFFLSPLIALADPALPSGNGSSASDSLLPPINGNTSANTNTSVGYTPATNEDGTVIPRATVVNESNPYQFQGNPNLTPSYVNAQIQNSIGKASSTATTNPNSITAPIANSAGCGAGQILAGLITGSVSSAVGNKASSAASKAVTGLTRVPVEEGGPVADAIKATTNAHTGTTVGLGGISTLAAPSWDSVAYCIVNAMIIYIADSTIRWINTGFKGNPSFLNNPDQFFKQLADEEAASFVQNLAYGATGVNVCNVFRAVMVQSILNQYANRNGANMGGYGANRGINNGFLGCTFDQNPNQFNNFVSGQNFAQNGGWNSWYNVSQKTNSNPYDTYFNTTDRLNNQQQAAVASQQQQLNWSNGFLSFRQCSGTSTSTKPTDTSKCPIVTPGTVIQNQLNSTLDLGKNRLVLATKFDQVVSALITQLISTALGTALSGVKK